MKNYKLILQSLLFLSCVLTSLIYAKDNTVVFVTLWEMSFVRDDSLYGNQTLKVPEINQNVMDNGGVLAFIVNTTKDKLFELGDILLHVIFLLCMRM